MFRNLGFLKKTQLIILTAKIIYIALFSLLSFFRSWLLLGRVCVNFTEFWPVQSDVPTHQSEKSSAIKFFIFFTLIMSLFLYFQVFESLHVKGNDIGTLSMMLS